MIIPIVRGLKNDDNYHNVNSMLNMFIFHSKKQGHVCLPFSTYRSQIEKYYIYGELHDFGMHFFSMGKWWRHWNRGSGGAESYDRIYHRGKVRPSAVYSMVQESSAELKLFPTWKNVYIQSLTCVFANPANKEKNPLSDLLTIEYTANDLTKKNPGVVLRPIEHSRFQGCVHFHRHK